MPQAPIQLASSVTDLPRIGPAKAKLLTKLNIRYVRDFLFTFPRDHEDFSQVTPVKDLVLGQKLTVKGKITKVKSAWGFQGKRRLLRIFVDVADNSGTLQVTWYNLRFLEKQLAVGREILIAGVVEKNKFNNWAMRSPALEFADRPGERIHTAAITPVYSETAGVTSRFIRYQVKQLLPLVQAVPEYMPADIVRRNKLMGIHDALRAVHFPKSIDELKAAEARLRFDELFFLQLAALVRRQHQELKQAVALLTPKSIGRLAKKLPFALTGAQERALTEIFDDMSQPHPMNRLLQGDVGSGKSAVSLLATQAVLNTGMKVMYLAPTEILARQQHGLFSAALGDSPVHLLIGAQSSQEKQQIKRYLAGSKPCVVIGTHALLQADVPKASVGLVIVDEQHRFGVAQRSQLQGLNSGTPLTRGERGVMGGEQTHPDPPLSGRDNAVPHLLSMTATPIPRTLNLTVYGDLDVSVLDEMPPGRQPITTKTIPPAKREEAIVHLLEEVHRGRQAYVIAPLVGKDVEAQPPSPGATAGQRKSAKKAYEEMRKWLPGIAVGLVHGQMKPAEKEAAMRLFAAGAIQVLVATAVVEVGVDVPNATMMIIEGAERFGLAQLHQFRGRIGRGEHASTCYLFPTTAEAAASRRLKIIEQTTDGFIIAEEDLKLRGPGEVYGLVQSGFSDLKVASLLDYPTIKLAREEAAKILKNDPELEKYPILRKKVEQKNVITHFE